MELRTALFFLLCASNAFACDGLYRHKGRPFEASLLKSPNIVLAKAIKAELKKSGFDVLYTFKTERVLAGKSAIQFEFIGAPESVNSSQVTFHNHFDEAFWKDLAVGRLGLGNGGCRMNPGFSVGDSYLMFLENMTDPKGFELIRRAQGDEASKDKWLQYVESHITPKS